MDVRSLGFRTNLDILRLGGSTVSEVGSAPDDYLAVHTPDNPTYWWGNFVLAPGPDALAVPDAPATWQARFAEQFPGAAHTAIGIDGTEAFDDALLSPWRAAGYDVTADVVLTTEVVTDPAKPNRDATYRPLADDDDWGASVELSIACNERNLSGYATYAADSAAAYRRLVTAGKAVWVGAFLDGDLVAQMGLVTCPGDLARYQKVETHPALRGRGLAGTLLAATARFGTALWAPSTFVIVADPGYHAIDIYRRAGFRDAHMQTSIERQPGHSR